MPASNLLFTINVYSHYFEVIDLKPLGAAMCAKLLHKYRHFALGDKTKAEPIKVYGYEHPTGSYYKFHIGQLPEFLTLLNAHGVSEQAYRLHYVQMPPASTIDLKPKPNWILKDYQKEVYDFCTEKLQEFDYNSRLIELPTGAGKTVTAMFIASAYSKRVFILILPIYMDKWASDVTEILDIDPKEVLLIAGSKQIAGVIDAAKEKQLDTIKVFIISLTTFNNFVKDYEQDAVSFKEFYGIQRPSELCGMLDVGTVIVDEIHQHLHIVYRSMLNLHVHKVIALSATFKSDDWFITKIQRMMFPKFIRYDKVKMEQYINVFAINYSINDIKRYRVRTSPWGRNTYSHVEYEKSILKNGYLKKRYLEMIGEITQNFYLQEREPGDKLAIYASTIDMCNAICEFLRRRHPELDTRTYNQGDPYENAMESDIRVTTVISAGTALDIKGLTTVLMTNSISSTVSNLQLLGRLRKIPNKEVRFVYLYCEQIGKQVDYHRKKMDMFRDRVASIKTLRYGQAL